jgi:AbrB family looped-hinge helix DNA binding protein
MGKILELAQMTLMRVRKAAQLTLPADVRRALNVQEGDFLEAVVVEGGVLLKPVAMVEREGAWQRIVRATSQVKDLEPNPNEDVAAEEERIALDVKASRRERKHG